MVNRQLNAVFKVNLNDSQYCFGLVVLCIYASICYYLIFQSFVHKFAFLHFMMFFKSCTANRNIPILMGHGDRDFLVPLQFGQLTEKYLKAFNPNVELKVYPQMEHSSCEEVIFWLLF